MWLPELWGAVLSGVGCSTWKQHEFPNPRVVEFLQGSDGGRVCKMVSGLQLWPCCLYHVQSDTVSVQVHAFPWNCVEYVIAKDVEQQLESRGKQQKPYRDKIVHCFTCRSQLISPSYHPECQLTAFPKSFRFLCCTGSVYFWGFVFGSWPRGEYSFLRHTWLAGYCTQWTHNTQHRLWKPVDVDT